MLLTSGSSGWWAMTKYRNTTASPANRCAGQMQAPEVQPSEWAVGTAHRGCDGCDVKLPSKPPQHAVYYEISIGKNLIVAACA